MVGGSKTMDGQERVDAMLTMDLVSVLMERTFLAYSEG